MLDKKYDHKIVEEKWMKYWEDEEIYEFSAKDKGEIFSVDTPPPTVSGKIHIGHIFSYTQAEIITRYNRLCGKNVFYPFGFDDNGLPTERLVEKENNIKAKDMNRNDFIKLCLETTEKYEKDFERLFKRLGVGADWSLKYSSINDLSRRISQRSFIELAKNGNAYYSTDPVMWCTECETSIAQAEVENKSLKSTFNHLKFKTTDGGEIEIATTRPEFLYSCVAIFIHPSDKDVDKLKDVKAIVPLYNTEVPIIVDDKVDPEKGSGRVMCCTFGDATDIEWWKKYELPLKELFDNEGKILPEVNFIGGLNIFEARKKIVSLLKEKDYVIKTVDIEHDVSTHERCGHEIEFKVKNGWFIKTLDIKDELIEYGDKINWRPGYMKARYKDWVSNLTWDWGISRQRFFGVPFPVWYCKDCGNIIYAKDEQLPVDPMTDNPTDPCPNCGSTNFIPEKDIMDTWATSSVTQLINMKWKEENSLVDKLLPMSLRPNAHDIIRTWDFYSIVKNYYHFKEIPWENVMISGFVMAAKGEKISKRKSNSKMEPINAIEEYSADVVRYWSATGRLGNDINFSEDTFKIGAKLVNKLFNVSKFVEMQLEDFEDKEFVNYEVMDKWIMNEYNVMLDSFKKYLDNYEVGLALSVLEKFFWDFCDNYIEIVKHRLYRPEDFGVSATFSGKKTIHTVLFKIVQAFSVFMPFVTEEIYQSSYKKYMNFKSIHKSNISKIDIEEQDLKVGEIVTSIVSKVRGEKTKNNLSLKTNVSKFSLEFNRSYENLFDSIKKDLEATLFISEIKVSFTDISDYKINVIELEQEKDDSDMDLAPLNLEKEKLVEQISKQSATLENKGFISNAPQSVVETMKSNLEKYKSRVEEIDKLLNK